MSVGEVKMVLFAVGACSLEECDKSLVRLGGARGLFEGGVGVESGMGRGKDDSGWRQNEAPDGGLRRRSERMPVPFAVSGEVLIGWQN